MDAIKLLKSHNLAITDVRMDLLDELLQSPAPRAYEQFRARTSRASFYRTMELFCEHGICQKIFICGRERFIAAGAARAFLHCQNCHATEQIAMPELAVQASSVLVSGLCASCESAGFSAVKDACCEDLAGGLADAGASESEKRHQNCCRKSKR